MNGLKNFLFPTPYTPEPRATMDAPYGVPAGVYDLMRYGVRASGVPWTDVTDDTVHEGRSTAERSSGYSGPELEIVGGTYLVSGNWRQRDGVGNPLPWGITR